jgi:hypothetical protein
VGGGGGGGGSTFKAQGPPPGFDVNSAMGLQQMAIGGDIQSYALSDQDFANRYPALQDAYNTWQANLGQQVGQVAQGAAGQQQIMGGLAGQILGRQGAPTTADITGIRNAAQTVAGVAQPVFNLGAQQAGLAPQLQGLAGQQAGIGGQMAGLGQGIAGMGAAPYNIGQQLLQEPIDPQTQQQMMRAGLGSAAGALGAASLGQGMAGQAAAARQLGLNTLQYGQAMRGEGMQDIGLAASIAGQGGQLQGLGAGALGGAAQTLGGAGAQLSGGANVYGLGGNLAASAGGLSNLAQGAQEQYGMNTAQMAQIYANMQQMQAANLQGNMGIAGQLFPKRPFGLGGTNMAQSELGQTGAYNSFQQANYATMNGIAFNQAQMQAQQQQLAAQQSAGMMSAGVGGAGAVASAAAAAAAITCWVARECLGTADSRWREFRLWLLNYAPRPLRSVYLRRGKAFAGFLSVNPLLKMVVRQLMLGVLQTQKKRTTSLLSLNFLLTA